MAELNKEGAKDKVAELKRDQGRLVVEESRSAAEALIMPALEKLAEKKAGKGAKPVENETYKMNTNPAVLGTETFRKMHVPGYGEPPKTAAQLEVEAKAEKQKILTYAGKIGIPEKDRESFVSYCEKLNSEWLRAAELESPAPRGHFLREMGQSDRDLVENANVAAGFPRRSY